jgi:hypothetical protein
MRRIGAHLMGAFASIFGGSSMGLEKGKPTLINDPHSYRPSLYGPDASPIFIPRKHTKESYRSQQRRAKQRRKSKNRP